MKNNVVNKKQYNKYFFIVLAVVLLIVAMTLVSLFGSKPVDASADTDYKYETYNQLIYTESISNKNVYQSQRPIALPILLEHDYNAGALGSSLFINEYFMRIDPHRFVDDPDMVSNYRSDNDVIRLNFIDMLKSDDSLFTYFSITFSYSSTSPRVFFSTLQSGNLVESSFSVNFLGDLFFLTINNEGLFFSTCSYYGDNLMDTRSAYERSLEHKFLILGKNSNVFSSIADNIVSEGSTIDFYYNDNSAVYFDFYEEFNVYKPIEVPVKEGYKFIGWYYDKDFTRPYNNEPITSDTELYAKYEPITYTVFFDTGAVEDPTDPNTSGLYDTSIQVPYGGIAEYTPDVGDNKHLLGWFYADGAQYLNTPIYEDTRLYAKWGAYITFDSNGGEQSFEPMVCELGQRYVFPKPTRDEYDFLYWEPVDVEVWHDGDPILYDMDLVAVWEKNVFLVTFYVDDKIFAEVKVNKGERLFSVVTETMTLEDKVVVGYENINVATVAVAFEEFEVVDDMVVYLSDSVTEDSSNNSSAVGFGTKVKDFFSRVKDFFVKVGEFFRKIFSWFKNLFSGSSNVVDVQGEQAESSSAVSELGQ